jgi:hypothetical protein
MPGISGISHFSVSSEKGRADQAPPSGPRDRLWLQVLCAPGPGFARTGRGGDGHAPARKEPHATAVTGGRCCGYRAPPSGNEGCWHIDNACIPAHDSGDDPGGMWRKASQKAPLSSARPIGIHHWMSDWQFLTDLRWFRFGVRVTLNPRLSRRYWHHRAELGATQMQQNFHALAGLALAGRNINGKDQVCSHAERGSRRSPGQQH